MSEIRPKFFFQNYLVLRRMPGLECLEQTEYAVFSCFLNYALKTLHIHMYQLEDKQIDRLRVVYHEKKPKDYHLNSKRASMLKLRGLEL